MQRCGIGCPGTNPRKEVTRMGVTNSNKVISTDRIACDGSLRVTLALTAAPDILTNPTDIVLALDRSGSMAGEPLANVKLGAKTFIDIIENATGGSGQIGSGSRIGVVSFATMPRMIRSSSPPWMSSRTPWMRFPPAEAPTMPTRSLRLRSCLTLCRATPG